MAGISIGLGNFKDIKGLLKIHVASCHMNLQGGPGQRKDMNFSTVQTVMNCHLLNVVLFFVAQDLYLFLAFSL